MSKSLPIGNMKKAENVQLTEEDRQRAREIWDDAEKMLALVDLIFGFEPSRLPPS